MSLLLLALLRARAVSRLELTDASPLLWVAKLVGALAGSLISIAYVLPRGRREAFLRFGIGVATGLIFGGTVGVKIADMLGVPDRISVIEMGLVGAATASLCAWWGLGILRRLAEQWSVRKQFEDRLSFRKKKDTDT